MLSLRTQYQIALKTRNEMRRVVARAKSLLWAMCNRQAQVCDWACGKEECKPLFCQYRPNAKLRSADRLLDSLEMKLSFADSDLRKIKKELYERQERNSMLKAEKLARSKNVAGTWTHIFNDSLDLDSIDEYIESFESISGEVCVSQKEDVQFTLRSNPIGVRISGKLSAQWNFDCWSKQDELGNRYATRRGNPIRKEGWIRPCNSRVVAIVCEKATPQIVKAARNLGLPIEFLKRDKYTGWKW